MGTYERLRKIDEFFNNLSIEEFETILIRSGIEDIKPTSEANMEMVLSDKDTPYIVSSIYFSDKQDEYCEFEPNENLLGAA